MESSRKCLLADKSDMLNSFYPSPVSENVVLTVKMLYGVFLVQKRLLKSSFWLEFTVNPYK